MYQASAQSHRELGAGHGRVTPGGKSAEGRERGMWDTVRGHQGKRGNMRSVSATDPHSCIKRKGCEDLP